MNWVTVTFYFTRVILTFHLYPGNNVGMETQTYTAFIGHKLLAHGDLAKVALKVKRKLKDDALANILIFSDLTGKQMDFDLRGTEKEVEARLQKFVAEEPDNANQGRGRPRLGVVAREVSLLPRHWEWLSNQSGGASATIRRLIDDVRKKTSGRDAIKQSLERTHAFMTAIGGDLPGYEEALRGLYAKDRQKFHKYLEEWPAPVKEHAIKLSAATFE
jgi:hypothetical protein